MPVPEINRLAHEILDILGGHPADWKRPEKPRSVVDCALVAIRRKGSKVDAAGQPFDRGSAERLQACYLALEALAPVRNDPAGEFQRRPITALLGLYAALERAEMQERAIPTPDLHADEETLLASSARPDNDMSRHEGAEGTR